MSSCPLVSLHPFTCREENNLIGHQPSDALTTFITFSNLSKLVHAFLCMYMLLHSKTSIRRLTRLDTRHQVRRNTSMSDRKGVTDRRTNGRMDGQTDPLIEVLHRTKKPKGASTGHAVLQSTSILPETKEGNGWTDQWTDGKIMEVYRS